MSVVKLNTFYYFDHLLVDNPFQLMLTLYIYIIT